MANRSIMKVYWNEVRAGFTRLPVWLPGTPMELGDVGSLDEGGWAKQTTLADLGVSFHAEPDGTPTEIEYSSEGGVEVVARTGGVGVEAAPVSANAHLTYRFHRAGAFVWRASNVIARRIGDLAAVDAAVLILYGNGTWRSNWVLVTEVVVGGPVLVLVAADRDTEVDIGVKAGTQTSPLTVGASRQFVASFRGSLAARINSDQSTPIMWRARRVADPLMRRAQVVDKTRHDQDEAPGNGVAMMDMEMLSDIP